MVPHLRCITRCFLMIQHQLNNTFGINQVEEYIAMDSIEENDGFLFKGSIESSEKSPSHQRKPTQPEKELNNTEMEIENLLISNEEDIPENMKRLTTDEINDIL